MVSGTSSSCRETPRDKESVGDLTLINTNKLNPNTNKLATPHPGDALSSQPVDFLPLGTLDGSQHTLTLTLTLTLVNAWGRDDTEYNDYITFMFLIRSVIGSR